MKSEERHHLHENDLAEAVDRFLKKVEPYSNQILIGFLAATVLAIGFLMWSRSSGGASDEAWAAFAKAEDADSFLTVADEYPKTDVANWARLRAAEEYLNQGLRTATSDRKVTEDNLSQAEETLQQLLANKSAVPAEIRERALYAMAVCREALCKGDTKAAVEAYKTLQLDFPESQYVSIAEKRVKDLETAETREFYAWFDQQPRKPDERPKPKDLSPPITGSTDPFILGDEPDTTSPHHPDRPPSPSTPVKGGPAAAPFPADNGEATSNGEAPAEGSDPPPKESAPESTDNGTPEANPE